MKHLLTFVIAFALATPIIAEAIKIDADFPGGNIKIVSMNGNNVQLAQDLRDTEGSWFYWSFRIRGAEGKTLHFEIPGVVGARGPAISYDGINWHWLSKNADFSSSQFDYTFQPDEKEVYFSQCINYTEKNLTLFLDKFRDHPALRVETLCKSEKGRIVELLRINENRESPFKVCFSSRHHCGETMGTYAIEGMIETVLSDTDDGKWLRKHCDFFIVPLVDKDGVEDGDQGKNRKPHDHNRDYLVRQYLSVKAMTEQVPKWVDNKPLFLLDLHCPWLRGGDDPTNAGKGTNEYFYFVGQDTDEKLTNALQRYSEILEKERKGTIPFKAINILPFGTSWNTAENYSAAEARLQSCAKWGTTLPSTVFASSTEIPFANAEGVVVDADSARALGKDLARAMRVYWETSFFPKESSEKPRQVSGIHPHLAMFNDEAECGVGTAVVWADRLWATTYGPHLPLGSSDKLYEITPELVQIIRPESVGGTHANRMIHRESEQLFIGLYAIDKERNVRVIPPKRMPGRQTGTVRHLFDPEGKVYYATMEEGLYEVDVKTLDVTGLIKDGNPNQGAEESKPAGLSSKLPGYHGKGLFSGQGRIVYANNGEQGGRSMVDPTIESGALGEWKGSGDWQLVRRNQFTEVSGPGGILGSDNPGTDPIWSIGWDHRSLILMVLDEGTWTTYRLPKTSHCYDGAHGWHTEWPRIREVGEGDNLLMTMHGAFWRFPKHFSTENSAGIEMRSTYLKVIGDFCRWNDRIVFACDDSAKSEFSNKRKVKGDLNGPGQSHSNFWFVEPAQLDMFGPLLGRGAVWMNEDVPAGQYSDPFWVGNDDFAHRTLYLKHDGNEPVEIKVETDRQGTGQWEQAGSIKTPNFTVLQPGCKGVWIRFQPITNLKNATVMFLYRGADNRSTTPDKKFTGLASLDDARVNGGVMLVRGANFRTLRCVMHDESGLLGVYDLDGDMQLKKKDDPDGLKWTSDHAIIPQNVIMVDNASVLVIDDQGKRRRLPKGDDNRTENGPLGPERVCREVSTERDLFHAHGTFYELPAENSGGFEKIRPVASHPYRIKDYASYRGMMVMSGLSAEASTDNPHIVKSDDGKCAVWCGAVDDLWTLGKVRGIGGPWKTTAVETGVPSDPYLMTGYDQKSLTLSHTAAVAVGFRIELDICGDGQWTTWKTVSVKPGHEEKLDIPLDAYWVRLVSTGNTTATATFVYE